MEGKGAGWGPVCRLRPPDRGSLPAALTRSARFRPQHFRGGLRKCQPSPHNAVLARAHHRPQPLASSWPAAPPRPSLPGAGLCSHLRPRAVPALLPGPRHSPAGHQSLLDGRRLLPSPPPAPPTLYSQAGRRQVESRAGAGWGLRNWAATPWRGDCCDGGATLGTFQKPRRGIREAIGEGCLGKVTFMSGLEEHGIEQGQVFQTRICLFNKHLLSSYFVLGGPVGFGQEARSVCALVGFH